jgi:phosphatidylserine decarboxylase
MADTVDSTRNRPGSIFTATLQTNVMVGNEVVARAGTTVHGRLTEARSGGRLAGRSELSLELTDMVIDGTKFPLLTGEYTVQGSSTAGSTARRTVAGAGLGTAIGAIGGNTGRGAAIGSVMGAGSSMATPADRSNIPAGTLL